MLGELAAAVGVQQHDVIALLSMLTARRLTIATAESLTGGLLTAVLTEVPGSSAVVRGGVVVYATDLKHTLAGVDDALLDRSGAVDPEVARQLATGARTRCGADIGLGLTGVAGPDPQDSNTVGTWYCALAGPDGYRDERAARPSGDRAARGSRPQPAPVGDDAVEGAAGRRREIRAAAVRAALEMLTNIPATFS